MNDQQQNENFEELARSTSHKGTAGELIQFLKENKKWWLLPIVLVLLAVGAVLILAGSAAAPFIYTLF